MMKSNYHTHTYLCHHAEGHVKDYVEKAIKEGFKNIGISDHGPLLDEPFPRMTIFEFFNIYLKEIEESKQLYGDKINIYKGLEIEYIESDYNYLKQLKSNLDYLVLGPHYFKTYLPDKYSSSYRVTDNEKLKQYEKMMVDAINTKLFDIIAHPDIFFTSYKTFDEQAYQTSKNIIQAAINNNCVLEINANGFRSKRTTGLGYPSKEFFKLAKDMGAKIIIGLDAHKPDELADLEAKKTIEFAEELNIDLIEEMEF